MNQMQWRRQNSDGPLILHLSLDNGISWRPYTAVPRYAKPDYSVPRGSKGWATYQALIKSPDWQLVATPQQDLER